MDEVERLTIELPADGLAEALDAVETGEFPSLEAAVAKALDAWTADRVIARIGIDNLRRLWDEGMASGDPQPLDVEDTIREALSRAEELRRDRRLAG